MTTYEGPNHSRTDTTLEDSATPTTVDRPPVAGGGASEPVRRGRVRKASTSRFEPDAIIAGAVGLVSMVIGLIAIVRAGFDGPLSTPVVKVLGFTHTTTLGFIEVGIGACLLLSATNRSRSGAAFFGGVLAIAGFVGAVQAVSFKTSLALESSMGWLAAVAGAVVVAVALMLPRFSKNSVTVRQD